MSIDPNVYLGICEIHNNSALQNVNAYNQSLKNLVNLAAEVKQLENSPNSVENRTKDLENITNEFNKKQINIEEKINDANKAKKVLGQFKDVLRSDIDKLLQDQKSKGLSQDSNDINKMIDKANLPDNTKQALKEVAELIEGGIKAVDQINKPALNKVIKDIKIEINKVDISIAQQTLKETAAKKALEARKLEAKEAAAKELEIKPFKDLKSLLLEEVGERKSAASMEAIVKIAEKAGLKDNDLKEVQNAAKDKIEQRSFFRKVADFFDKNSDKKEIEISSNSKIAEALTKIIKINAASNLESSQDQDQKSTEVKKVVQSIRTGLAKESSSAITSNNSRKQIPPKQGKDQGQRRG